MADWQKQGHWLPMSRAGSWYFSKTMRYLDRLAFWLSGGKVVLTEIFTGVPTLRVTSTGAKSGQARASFILAIPDGADWIIIASNWGMPKHPAWYFNLKAHPQAQVEHHGTSRTMTARILTGEERETCWHKALAYYKVFDAYKARAGREIPVFKLEENK